MSPFFWIPRHSHAGGLSSFKHIVELVYLSDDQHDRENKEDSKLFVPDTF
jgi:hypothetical protein